MDAPPLCFFGYPYNATARRDAITEAARQLTAAVQISAKLWEDLKVNGRFVIDPILATIESADVAAFDVTELNHNVMFELGYAIGKNRRVWLLRDDTYEAPRRDWDKIKVLTTIGHSKFVNAEDIVKSFYNDLSFDGPTIFESTVQDYLQPAGSPAVLYLPSLHTTEAERKLKRRISDEQKRNLRVIVADPTESAIQPLSWYAQQVYSAYAVVVHLTSPGRQNAGVHNARCALVAGLALGMQKKVLMLAEQDYTTPIDYRDLMVVYSSSRVCVERADAWLSSELAQAYEDARTEGEKVRPFNLAVELRTLRLGDFIAENEAEVLGEYFVNTASFEEVMRRNTTVFVGRKGTGKTANMLQAAEQLRGDKRNLVCVMKPAAYEVEALVEVLSRFNERSEQGHFVESLWKFLIYSEIANSAYEDIQTRPAAARVETETAFTEYMEVHPELTDDFGVRLEKVMLKLHDDPNREGDSLETKRLRVSEALHSEQLLELREQLGRVLTERNRVAVLIDNLDKAWDKRRDLGVLSQFLLGLLGSIGRIADEFSRSDHWRSPVGVTLAVFLRSDIYDYVVRVAREPDKIPVSRLNWSDNELLLLVIGERYAYKTEKPPEDIWERFFTAKTKNLPSRDYILGRILPRPRDLIFYCSAAIASAVNRRSNLVEEYDVLDAERVYSQFAFEALLVENGITVDQLESVLYEFAGERHTLSLAEVSALIEKAGVGEGEIEHVIEHLQALSFLGLEIGEGKFDFRLDERTREVADALSRKRRVTAGEPVYQIHPAFRRFLEMEEDRPKN